MRFFMPLEDQPREPIMRPRPSAAQQVCRQSDRPQSSLVKAGRGGQPQDPDATLPVLYIAGRDVNFNPPLLENSRAASTVTNATCGALRLNP